jgi:hypothetical protein
MNKDIDLFLFVQIINALFITSTKTDLSENKHLNRAFAPKL